MKLLAPLLGGLATTSAALSFFQPEQAVFDAGVAEDHYLIELGPGNTRWIKEDEKWALRRVCADLGHLQHHLREDGVLTPDRMASTSWTLRTLLT